MVFVRPDIIRPPSEAGSYFLPLTAGCSNNSCGFCIYYGCQLKIRPATEVKTEIDALALYSKHGLRVPEIQNIVYVLTNEWDGRRIFLQDGDALVYPHSQLKDILEYLNGKFPQLERIACYGTAQDILRYDLSELKNLKSLKLGIVYLGVENGDDEILHSIGKGVNAKQIIEAGQRIKATGILSSVTVILGLGGLERSREHALATAKVLTELDPDFVGALTLTLVPGTPMYKRNLQSHFSLISPMQSLQELKIIIENAVFTDCFFSSMHASNYFSLRGKLPQNKAEMLSQLDNILSRQEPSLLRSEFMRGL